MKRIAQNALAFRQRHRGDTMIETLVAVFILVLIVGVVFQMYLMYTQEYYFYDSRARLVQLASDAATELNLVANSATAIEPTWNVAWKGVTYTSDAGTVIFKTASIDTSGNPITGQFDHIIVTPKAGDPTKISEITDANTAGGSARANIEKTIGSSVGEYIFTYQNADPATSPNVGLTITMTKALAKTTVTHTLQTYAKLRNK